MYSKSLVIFLVIYILSDFSHGQKNQVSDREDYTYIEAGKSFYKIHTTRKNWNNAKQECALQGASLFYPENSDEANAVISFWTLVQNSTYPKGTWVFVGISDIKSEGVYETIDGKSISEVYNTWVPGQPDNNGDEDCLHLNQEGNYNDVDCTMEFGFICKKNVPSLERNIQQSNSDGPKNQESVREDYTYIEAGKSFYKIHTTRKNWSDAKRECALEGASLFYPENSDEANAVISFWTLGHNSTHPEDTWVFVGISDIKSEGVYETIDGKSISEVYNSWVPGQPDDRGDEDCLHLNQEGNFNDVGCTQEFSFICKKSVPSLELNSSSNIQQSNLDGQKNEVSFHEDYTYIESEESYYKIHTTQKNWRDAKRECALEGASLFYPENSDEANAVISFWKLSQTDFTRVFVGISDIITEGVYETIDGKSLSEVYNTWRPDQPDNFGNEDCLELNQEGMLNDIQCDDNFSFICKKSFQSLERNCSSNIQQSNLDGQRDKKLFRKDYNYIEAVESFYKIHLTQKTWLDAKRECALEGASLFYPDSRDEANAVIAFWNTTFPNTAWTVSVGLTDIMTEGVFETVDGKSISEVYNQWRHGEPNNYGGVEDCVQLNQQGYTNDVPCDYKYRFICKKTLRSLEWNYYCNMSNLDYSFDEDIGKCYKLHSTPLNWMEAHAVCRAEQSYLAVINNQLEAEYLVNLTESAPKRRVGGSYQRGIYHMGFHYRLNEGWQTVRGTPINDDADAWWDNFIPTGDEQNMQCGSMLFNGLLNNINCDTKSFFICEHAVDSLLNF